MTIQRIWSAALDSGLNYIDSSACCIYLLRQTVSTLVSTAGGSPDIFTYAQAISTINSFGYKTGSAGSVFGSPAASSVNGRTIASVAITDGTITATGIVSGWALVGTTVAQTLFATGLLSSASTFSSTTNQWALPAFEITLPSST